MTPEQHSRLAYSILGLAMVVAAGCLVTAFVMLVMERYAYSALFLVAYFLAHVCGCLCRDVWGLFDADSLGRRRVTSGGRKGVDDG